MNKNIKIGDKEYVLKELNYVDTLNTEEGLTDRKQWFVNMVKNSIIEPTMTDEDIKNLTFKEGNEMIRQINILNGIGTDFPKPSQSEKES